MSVDGKISSEAAHTGIEHPDSQSLIDLMKKAFQQKAREGKIKASAIAYDIRTIPPGATVKTDAIAVDLDHVDNYSIVVIIPYKVIGKNDVTYGETFATKGEGKIFPKK